MWQGILLNAAVDLIRKGKKNKEDARGAGGLQQLIQHATADAAKKGPSAQQQDAIARASSPLTGLLNPAQGPAPQQSALPTGQLDPAMANAVAAAQALQSAKGGTAGLDYLVRQTDPMAQAQLQGQQITNAGREQANTRGGFDYQQALERAAATKAFTELPADAFGEAYQAPALQAALKVSPEDAARNMLAQQGRQPRLPTAAIQNYNFRGGLPEDERATFDRVQRAVQFVPGGGGAMNSLQREGGLRPLITAEEVGANESARDVTKSDGMRRYEAALESGKIAADEAEMRALFDNVNSDKHKRGFERSYGIEGAVPFNWPGGDAANFEPFIKQVQGKNFLEAYKTLKGGGQITEVEGIKATEAMSRIGARTQGDESAREAWAELEQIIMNGYARARAKAKTNVAQQVLGGAPGAPGAPAGATKRYNPATGKIEAL